MANIEGLLMERDIRIIQGFQGVKEGAVCYRTGVDKKRSIDMDQHAYEDGAVIQTSALRMLYRRLTLGDTFPGTMILSSLDRWDDFMAATLFAYPDVVLHDRCGDIMDALDRISQFGDPGWAHISYDARLLASELENLLDQSRDASERDQLRYLQQGVTLLRDYIQEGVVPSAASDPLDETPLNIDMHTHSVMIYRAPSPHVRAVYGKGAFVGVWIDSKAERVELIYKKSDFVQGNWERLGQQLNRWMFDDSHPNAGWCRLDHPLQLRYPSTHPDTGEPVHVDCDLDTMTSTVRDLLFDEVQP